MQFKEIPGKDEVKEQLGRQVDNGRIPHAQLFLGKEGSGGLAMALAYASYIMCENRADHDSCGDCNHCRKTSKQLHPDVHFSFPVVKIGDKKRAETTSDDFLPKWREMIKENPFFDTNQWLQHIDADNNLPNINVKECNDIMHKLNLMSYESDFKILIMWLPEYLGTEGNRLLKLIEEPTDNTFIILVSENQEMMLQTILSRCQLVKIPLFEDNEICDFLINHEEIPSQQAQQIANLADGNMSLAINIAHGEAADYSDKLLSWLRASYKLDPIEINTWISTISNMSKDDQKNFFEYGLHFFRQFIQWIMTKNENISLTAKELETVTKMSSLIDLEKAEDITNILNEAIESIHRNINIKIMLFADSLTIGEILRKK
ncbi:MAG: hypothetical protein IPO92_03465 [Saprospiraceae bacterium]|nr:hypothetical protein [Saprospiraceae bacterium]